MIETYGGEVNHEDEYSPSEDNKKSIIESILSSLDWMLCLKFCKRENLFMVKKALIIDQPINKTPHLMKKGDGKVFRGRPIIPLIGLYNFDMEIYMSIEEYDELIPLKGDIEKLRKSLRSVDKFNL
jgi:hypothetical protein